MVWIFKIDQEWFSPDGSINYLVKENYSVNIMKNLKGSCGCQKGIIEKSKGVEGTCKHVKECRKRASLAFEFLKELGLKK